MAFSQQKYNNSFNSNLTRLNPPSNLGTNDDGQVNESTTMGKGDMAPEFPGVGRAQPAHMGSQSMPPSKGEVP